MIFNIFKNKSAFSIIELVVVMIVISFLIAGVTSCLYLMKNANLRATITEVNNYRTSIFTYYENTGNFPGAVDGTFKFENSCIAWKNLQDKELFFSEHKINDCEIIFLNRIYSIPAKIKGAWYALGNRVVGNTEYAEFKKNSIALFGGKNNITFDNATFSIDFDKSNLALTLKDALYIDDKSDDGNLDTGDVIGVGFNHDSCGGEGGGESLNSLSCVLFFNLGF
ncbi:MAG: type II secretion system GspH family protein [Rickettsiales bacterium]|jgi:type II secretory pathway pseudopilin PulG|nr:type II secretion system GspH family protein [Rickettsiales bacterium]